jgi:predicted permease
LIARLRPGVTPAQATEELSALMKRFDAERPAPPRDVAVVVRRFDDVIVGGSRPAILALLAAVCLVLLIANANVANLLLMRAETRRAELAVQIALGAGAHRITRQLLIEGVILGLFGTAAGIAVSSIGLPWLIAIVPDGVPRPEAVHVDLATVAMVTMLTIAAVLLTTLGPAVLSARIELAPELRGGRGATTETGRVRRVLLVSQVALALTVVAGAGVLIRTVLRLQSIDVGLPVDRLAIAFLEMPKSKYADQARHLNFLQNAVDSLEAVPMIAAATPVNNQPFAVSWGVPAFFAEGQDLDRAAANPALGLEAVHENYFKTLGIRILRGRAFTADDRKGTAAVAILSEDAAARTWPGQDPIGKRLKWGSPSSRDPWLTVVGVAAKTRYQDLTVVKPTIYVPAVQLVVAAQRLLVRSDAPIDRIAPAIRDAITRIDPDVRVMRVSAFGAMFDAPLAHPRFNALLLGIFAGIALLLTSVGHYAVMAAHVRQREREIAIRMALGATAWEVRRLVLADVFRLAVTGAAVGLAGALVGTRLLRGFLSGLDSLDPLMLGGAALLLIAASTLSTLTPVRRASRIDAPALLRS